MEVLAAAKGLKLTVEIAEDVPDIFGEALQSVGYETLVIRDGQKATDRLAVAVPDLIVLDLRLPHVSGMDILEMIRADERLQATRVVVATADPQLADLLHDKSHLVLLKPVSFKQLRLLAARLAPVDPKQA